MKVQFKENKIWKMMRSPISNFNFNKETGFMMRWGKTQKDDAVYSPFPEILDIEVSERCDGPGGKLCPFCSPAGTKVNTPFGDVNIEDIKKGDIIWSATSLNTLKPRMRHNTVEEVYSREFTGNLICIELENGAVLKLTPEHPVITKGGAEVLAKDLLSTHEIIHIDDFEKCKACNNNIDSKYRYNRHYCSSSCFNSNKIKNRTKTCLICNNNFIGKTKKSKFCCINSGDYASKHRLYNIWQSMIFRCYDPSRINYKHYGAKGIKVSNEWLVFDTFKNDMETTFVEGLELERLSNDIGYCKSNCVWIPKRENRQHRSQPHKSKNPYKCCTPYNGKYIASAPSLSGLTDSECLGTYNTQKECVELYNKRIIEIYPTTGNKYIQIYKGEL